MDSVLLDTNVLLDFYETPRPEHSTSAALLEALAVHGVVICAAATSLKDLYYIVARRLDEPSARRAAESVMATMVVLPVDAECCRQALASTEPDFEDAIIRAAAETARVDFIISRDAKAFVGSRVPRLSPADALAELRHR